MYSLRIYPRFISSSTNNILLLFTGRKINKKLTSISDFTFYCYASCMCFHNTSDIMQAETKTINSRTGMMLIEFIKNKTFRIFTDSHTVVGDTDSHILSGMVKSRDSDIWRTFGIFQGIIKQVVENIAQMSFIGLYYRFIC